VQVVGPAARNKNLVVRYRGTGARKPLLLMGHRDVVEALRGDWSVDPFVLTERDGYYDGRGTQEDYCISGS
jgi:acetylornithine deacetylase/succinyl-diaminopimelate desuccinylase-like protein